ncbi:ER membrane protein DP1/Yop1 [Yamadazyma tenuis]|uniref:Protein YOP1 n=1 Tax=Candida tenuis (strain ATCC 10573 / BCRC 21748 / CBS 615 / JCM 9827 / NBRC 10315 / NRRL Y-1498 / VKM Y-70) TaxID=590646 RepID=G3AWH3_CANTC|nr:uncharacterized protein CANTEDRAFT_112260 [Yamadazyma tenuis ATCC 10573]XP_006684062.1 uncharacterized protein CANTEDRAFT_112260 [Yamadazyma tenuis ATCC 10573]EGV66803.1 hypothetical protein CANTEDRAFT_112260 [Yamadazyma tenuis ATCC 10573]EGV66804.1 hypothetical protein CANTEDRAFT_112260 [Yamadazyma tenuis ATCC 10573]WEJ95338.1 ER membrane protein DP1/Yop1 [Yamadazyma tenuis]
MDQITSILSQVDARTSHIGILGQFEQQSGLPRSYAVIAAIGVYFVLIFLNVGGIGQLLSNIAGFVVPGYYSLVALDTPGTDDDTKLLTYWVVFAFLNVIEFWSKAILYWIPFYWLFKTVFLLYIGIPAFGGAVSVYNSIIKPISDQVISGGGNIAHDIDDLATGVSTGVNF